MWAESYCSPLDDPDAGVALEADVSLFPPKLNPGRVDVAAAVAVGAVLVGASGFLPNIPPLNRPPEGADAGALLVAVEAAPSVGCEAAPKREPVVVVAITDALSEVKREHQTQ